MTVYYQNQNDNVPSIPIAPSSLLGMPTYLPPGQVTAQHVMHQQGVAHSVASHVGHYSMPAMSSIQQWQNQQVWSNQCIINFLPRFSFLYIMAFHHVFQTSAEGFQQLAQNQLPPSQTDQSFGRSDVKYEYEMSVNGQAIRPDYPDHISQGLEPNSVISSSAGKAQVL